MNITEFAESRNVRINAVSNYISRHPEIKDLTKKVGKETELSPEAVALLDKAYPLPKPVEIIEDTESRQKLIKAQELIIQLQDKLNTAQMQIAKAEAQQMLLEDKEEQLKKAENRINTIESELSVVIAERDKERVEAEEKEKANILQITELSAEIERIKGASLFDRIFKKY